MQLSAVTGYLTANLAPIPLLWILPLAVYLLTLILPSNSVCGCPGTSLPG